jgi:hypothetical protein
MGCECSEGLGALVAPRKMTSSEIAAFLSRHPIVARMILQTETAMRLGLYDYNYNPATQYRLPGTIPPWGIQILEDSELGNVVVFPARDETWRYTAFTPILGDINDPDYVSATFPEGIAAALLGDISRATSSIGNIVLMGALVYVGYLVWSKKPAKK